MSEIYLTISLSTHNEDDTPQNYAKSHLKSLFSPPPHIIRSLDFDSKTTTFPNTVSFEIPTRNEKIKVFQFNKQILTHKVLPNLEPKKLMHV